MTRSRDPVELGSPGITGSLADAPSNTLNADPGDARVASQLALLPAPWRAADRGLLKATEYFVVAIGMTFAVMITLQVISRYVFSFSISFVEAAARMLLVWFFVLGAGLA
ncbi:MAG: TRAP transporter small permease, partial [Burkholderiales bacterium]